MTGLISHGPVGLRTARGDSSGALTACALGAAEDACFAMRGSCGSTTCKAGLAGSAGGVASTAGAGAGAASAAGSGAGATAGGVSGAGACVTGGCVSGTCCTVVGGVTGSAVAICAGCPTNEMLSRSRCATMSFGSGLVWLNVAVKPNAIANAFRAPRTMIRSARA